MSLGRTLIGWGSEWPGGGRDVEAGDWVNESLKNRMTEEHWDLKYAEWSQINLQKASKKMIGSE